MPIFTAAVPLGSGSAASILPRAALNFSGALISEDSSLNRASLSSMVQVSLAMISAMVSLSVSSINSLPAGFVV